MRLIVLVAVAAWAGASEGETPDTVVAWIKDQYPESLDSSIAAHEAEAKLRLQVSEAFGTEGPEGWGDNVTIFKVHSPHKTVNGREACGSRDVIKSWKNIHYIFPVIFGGMREGRCEAKGYSHYEGQEVVKDPPIPFPVHHMLTWDIWSTQQPAPPAQPPSAMGNFSTESEYFYVGGFKAGSVQDAYIVYPASGAGPFPMVAFAHGAFKKTPNDTAHDYAAILDHVASQGIVVAAFNDCLFECNTSLYSADQLHLVAALRDNLWLHPVLSKVDFTRVALMGHSMGGAATIASAGQGMEGIVAAAAIHPHAIPLPVRPGDASHVQVPMFYMCGEKDPVVPCAGVKKMYDQTPTAKKVFAELQDAGHTEIQKPLPGGRWDFYIVEFMRCHLMKDHAACGNIYGTSQDALCTAGLMVDCQHSQPAPLVVV